MTDFNICQRTTDPKSVATALLLADFEEVDKARIASWTYDQRAAAFEWAMREHLHASDNDDVVRLPEPSWVRDLRTV
jgi:hypothetical protein